ncbi:MAG: hypothetical protein AABZ74_12250 [Cyanobacteriota bacterium]
MKKILSIFSTFFILITQNSCINQPTLGDLFNECAEISSSPSKSYDELIKAKNVIEYKGNKYIYEIHNGSSQFVSPRRRVLCCDCKKMHFSLLKNYVKHESFNRVTKIEEYIPNKVFIVYEKKKFIYEFVIDEQHTNYATLGFDKYGKIEKFFNIDDISVFLILKNQKNEEIILKASSLKKLDDLI